MRRVLSARPAAVLARSVGDLFRDPRFPKRGNTVLLGLGAIVLLTVVFLASIGTPQLFYLLRTSPYTVKFANVGGLREGNPVLVAGVPSGRVDGLYLSGDVAVAEVRIDRGLDLGTATTATIGLKSVLGNRTVELTPSGPGALDAGDVIPISRTSSPYTLDDLGEDIVTLAEEVDHEQVGEMINTLDSVLPQNEGEAGRSIDLMAESVRVLAEDSGRVDELLRTTREVTGVLAEQEESLETLTSQAHTVVVVLAQRREQLSDLVVMLEDLTVRVAALLSEESDDLDRLLATLRSVSETYQRNIDVLDEAMTRMPPGLRAVADATGTGRWTDVTAPSGPIPDSALCAWGVTC